jgi:hypothetical protein
LGVIALAYSCIAPLVLGFATIGFTLMYLGFRYNCLFTLGTDVSTRGRCYARALQQLTTGLYLAEVCLIGLYALGISQSRASIGPLVLMVFFLAATIVWQVLLKRHLSKMEKTFSDEERPSYTPTGRNDTIESDKSPLADGLGASHNASSGGDVPGAQAGADRYDGLLQEPGNDHGHVETQPGPMGFMAKIQAFLHPSSAATKTVVGLAPHLSTPVRPYTRQEHEEAYMHPAAVSETPTVWIARDEHGISKKETHDSQQQIGKGFDMTDEGAWFNAKGKIEWHEHDPRQAPIWEDDPLY